VKAQNTTPMMTPAWGHHGAIALAALIALLVIGLALLYTPNLISRTARDTTVRPSTQQLIAHCRVCQDEALGASQINLPAAQPAPPIVLAPPPAQQLIAHCRVCRDEALGAVQSGLTTVDFAPPVTPPTDRRQSGPR